jgi:hypothetical protein
MARLVDNICIISHVPRGVKVLLRKTNSCLMAIRPGLADQRIRIVVPGLTELSDKWGRLRSRP